MARPVKKQIGVLCKPGSVDLFKRLESITVKPGTWADIEFVKIEHPANCHGRTLAGLLAMADADQNPHYKELLMFAINFVR